MILRNPKSILVWAALIAAWAECPRAQDQPTDVLPPVADGCNSGVIASLSLETQPRRIRRFEREGGSIGEAKAYEGMIYVSKSGSMLYALRGRDGKRLWVTAVCRDYVTGVACSCDPDNDYVVATSYQGAVAVDRATGRTIWQRDTSQGLAGAVIVDKRVYAGGYDGNAYCLNLASGDVLWTHDYLEDAPEDPPGFVGKRARLGDRPARPREASCDGTILMFAVFDQCRLIALDCQTGKRLWAFQTEGWMLGRPTISDKYVFAGSQDKHFYCVNKADGSLVWKFKTGARIEAPGAVTKDRVFFGSCDANLYCVDKDSGQLQWKYATQKRKKFGGPIYEQPLVSGGTVFLPTMEGQIYAIKAKTGKQIWKIRPSRKSEIDGSFSNGKQLFVTTRVNFEDEGEDALYVLGK